jgi:putative acetyltransferase
MIVRRERADDVEDVRDVHVAAFRRSLSEIASNAIDPAEDPFEARLLDALRTSGAWILALSFVATSDGSIVGHAVCSRAHVGARPVVALGPIAVRPEVQHGGIGSALMHTIVGAADALGEPLIGLLGSDRYYGRFGFVAASELGIVAPDPGWGGHFQVRTLFSYDRALRGPFRYSAPFAAV